MIFYSLLTIWAIVLAIIFFNSSSWNRKGNLTITTVMGAIVVGFLTLISCASPTSSQEYKRENCSCPIYSVRTMDSVEGRFYYHAGWVGHQEFFSFYFKDERGAYLKQSFNARNVRIFETSDDSQPKMTWQKVYYRVSTKIIPWFVDDGTQDTIYDIYVPKGTVVLSFNAQ